MQYVSKNALKYTISRRKNAKSFRGGLGLNALPTLQSLSANNANLRTRRRLRVHPAVKFPATPVR